MKRIITTFLAALAMLLPATVRAATYNALITVSAGASNTGQASNILVTIYDNQRNVLVSASNAPDGTHGFVESSVTPGNFTALYPVDTSKLPLYVEPAPLNVGGLVTNFSIGQIDGGRAAQVADGYTAALAANTATTNTRVDATTSSRLAASAAPANFSSLAITGGGGVTVSSVATGVIANDVWNALIANYTGAGSMGLAQAQMNTNAATAAANTASVIAAAVKAGSAPTWYVSPATLAQIQALLPSNFGVFAIDGNGKVSVVSLPNPAPSGYGGGGSVVHH